MKYLPTTTTRTSFMRSWAVTRRAPPHPSVALARKRYSGARAHLGEPSPYADAAAVGAVPAQMWEV